MASIQKRTTPTGTVYQVRIRVRGFPTQTKTFDKAANARLWAQQTESEIKNGLYFKKHSSTKHTFAEMIDRYVSTVMIRKIKSRKFYVNQLHQLEWWKSYLGAFLLSNVEAAQIAEFRDKLIAPPNGKSVATGNRYLAALSHVYSIAFREWGWVDENPVRKVSRLKEPRGRTRFLDINEQRVLLEACKKSTNPHLLLAVLMAISTGARQMEILGLQWKDVDFDRAQALLVHTKNGEQRSIPLVPSVLKLLQERYLQTVPRSPFVFSNDNYTRPARIHWVFQKTVRQVGLEDFRFHDLRHTAASYLAMSGATLTEIAEILGHKTLQMVKRYSHISIPHTRKVIERMNSQFIEIDGVE
jgi:integrase